MEYLHILINHPVILPPEISQLTELRLLGVTILQEIPPQIFELTNLEILFFGGENIRSLPEEIEQLTKLTVVEIADCYITHFPATMKNLQNLISLTFRNMDISETEMDKLKQWLPKSGVTVINL